MKTAMILAAGRGVRLKPLTDLIPKSLCLVRGLPLIEHHVRHLANAGIQRIVINHAHLGGQIRQYLGHGSRFGVEIFYSPEPPGGLETGGGIVSALPLLGSEPFITVNADIYTDYDFRKIDLPKTSLAHLVLVNNDSRLKHYGDFCLSEEGMISTTSKDYTFAGIAIYRPELFKNLPIGRYSITTKLFEWIENGAVSGELFKGCWFDIGSKERLRAANQLSSPPESS